MKRPLLAFIMALGLAGGAHASLVGRDINGNAVAGGDASSVFLYDTVLNVTWLRDANYAKTTGYSATGGMTWYSAYTWAANLTVGTYGGWRLPTMIDTGTEGCNQSFSGTDCGYNVQTKSGSLTQYQAGQTVYNEMASLWYDTLGNKARYTTAGSGPQAGWGLTNTGDFQNMESTLYWAGPKYALDPAFSAWYFYTNDGYQNNTSAGFGLFAMAVRLGDVLAPAAVPLPAAAWLMLSGIGALGAAARRRKSLAVQA